ncbi:MAG: ABC transporter permease [Phycisphaerales bacterium]|nr:ABC transporter permease [Planctomycetota bacterium]
MTGLVVRRLLQLPIILGVIYTLTLVLAWRIPGNPLENPDGRRPQPEVVAAMQRQYNLDSFWSFYWSYLDSASGVRYLRDKVTGRAAEQDNAALAAGRAPPTRSIFDLGPSLQYRDQRVNDIIAGGLPVSMTLGAAAIFIALILGVLAGVIGAVRPNSTADLSTLGIALVGISLPTFVIGAALLLIFPVLLGWGRIPSWGRPVDLLLPAFTLSLPFAAYIARLTRMGMIEQLHADYIRTARAKGVSETGILFRHALKNAFLPVLSYLGPAAAFAMTGSFVVERVFVVPGIGQHFVNAVQNKDLFLIIAIVLIYATMLIVFNLIVDVLYRWIDPRIV